MKWLLCNILFASLALTQSNPNFNVSLRLDFSSIDGIIELGEGRIANVNRVAELRGNQIAAATSALLARRAYSPQDFSNELERFRSGSTSSSDMYGLRTTSTYLQKIKTLLQETKNRQLDRKIIATIEPFFPQNIRLNASFPVYFVAMGNENASAFVRRIEWNGNTPMFVGEGRGELTIVVNLTRSVQYIQEVQLQFVNMMSTLAHETFHAVFGVHQNNSSVWRGINNRNEPYWRLAELVQNEGLAYLISFQQLSGASISASQLSSAKEAVNSLNSALKELTSPSISPSRARDLIMNSNLSGSFEKNYGATAGLLMAYAIDSKLGRLKLTETLDNGVGDFFQKYQKLTEQFGELPKFDERVVETLSK